MMGHPLLPSCSVSLDIGTTAWAEIQRTIDPKYRGLNKSLFLTVIFELMEGDHQHPSPFRAVPILGPFQNYDLPNLLGIEWKATGSVEIMSLPIGTSTRIATKVNRELMSSKAMPTLARSGIHIY